MASLVQLGRRKVETLTVTHCLKRTALILMLDIASRKKKLIHT